MFKPNFVRVVLLPVLLLLFVSLSTIAQTATATLSGVVQDERDAVIAGAKVAVTDLTKGLKRNVVTNSEGQFTVPLLPPGTYTVTVSQDGFGTVQVNDLVLNVADNRALNIQLKVGDVSGVVNVDAETVAVRIEGNVATVIDRTFVGNMPLNGRSFSSLVLLTPGVTVTPAASSSDTGQFSVNGQRASANAFTIDGVGANIGISNTIGGANTLSIAGAYPGTSALGGTSNLVSIDALEEFKIQTSSYTADLGRQPGGQIQVVTRSGSNDFHGSLFEYFRNEALDARNYFNTKPAPETPLRQNLFGGTVGGPIFKNKVFFFFSYEGHRLRLPLNTTITVPSLRLRQIAAAGLQPVLNAFPTPTGPEELNPNGTPSGRAPASLGLSNPSNLDATGIRIDYAISNRHNLFGRFNESPSDTISGVANKRRELASTRTLTVGLTSLFGQRITNEARANYSRQRSLTDFGLSAIGGAVPFDLSLLTSGYSGFGSISFRLGTVTPIINGGTSADSFQRQINIVDNVSFLANSHRFRFGVDFRRLSPLYGLFDTQSNAYTNEASIISGVINTLRISTIQPARPQFSNLSFYSQDTWKASRRLTLDLGLRWEINPAPTEANGNMPPLAIGIVGTNTTNATLAPPGTRFYKTDYSAFAPRVGAAYQLRTTPGRETVLRGGFGVYYDLGNGAAAGGWPFLRTIQPGATAQCPKIFPVSASCAMRPGIITVPTLPTGAFALNENLKLPYTLHWNFAVEQSLGEQQSLSVSYVASAARRLLTRQIINYGATYNAPYQNPNFFDITFIDNGPTSNYQSMQTQYHARFRQRFQALINYTWSHAIDDVSSDIQFNILERGNANFDVRHNFSAAIHYDFPTIDAGPFVKALLRNWSMDTIVHAQSGRPIDIADPLTLSADGNRVVYIRPNLITGVPLYLSDPSVPGGRRFNPAAFSSPLLAPDGSIIQGNFGRNVLRELPLYQVDLSLARSLKLTETLRLQIRTDVFNVFNHPMFGSYGARFSTPDSFGVPFDTMNSSLGGLSSLYQLGGPRSIQLSARLSF